MHLLSLAEWSRARIDEAMSLAEGVRHDPRGYARELAGKILLMLFEKPSLRTRVSFEAAMLQLGGHAMYYDLRTSPWGAGKESAADTARTASRYVDGILARLFRADDLAEIAAHATVPVINGLTDLEHPCQALGDLLTIRDAAGRWAGAKLAYVGDANNNVTHSLLHAAGRTGMAIALGCPRGPEFEPRPEFVETARAFARESGGSVEVVHDAAAAVADADFVYADTWMGYHVPPDRREARRRALEPFRVTEELMGRAKPDARFLHCLPAQRGEEVSAAVIDGPRSLVFDQAENRLHTEKAILLLTLGRASRSGAAESEPRGGG